METLKHKKEYECSFQYAIDNISGKWKGLLLWHLHDKTVLRHSELKKALGNITQKMLTQTLRELEINSIINRKVYPQVPPKVEYSLTEHGKTLIPILSELYKWGEQTSKELGKTYKNKSNIVIQNSK